MKTMFSGRQEGIIHGRLFARLLQGPASKRFLEVFNQTAVLKVKDLTPGSVTNAGLRVLIEQEMRGKFTSFLSLCGGSHLSPHFLWQAPRGIDFMPEVLTIF